MEQVAVLPTVVPQPDVPYTLHKSLKCPNMDRMSLQHHPNGSISWGMLRCSRKFLAFENDF